jgi:hypothetical protein
MGRRVLIVTDPATGAIRVEVEEPNDRIFFEGREQDWYYTSVVDDVVNWLDVHDPDWDIFAASGVWCFSFSSMAPALLFKLTWGGV